jgi:hypothetical protein
MAAEAECVARGAVQCSRPAGNSGGEAKTTAAVAPLFWAERETERRKKKGGFAISRISRGLTVNLKFLAILGLK